MNLLLSELHVRAVHVLHDRDFAVGLVQNNELSDQFEFHVSLKAKRYRKLVSTPCTSIDGSLDCSFVGRGNIRNHIHEMFQHRLVTWQVLEGQVHDRHTARSLV